MNTSSFSTMGLTREGELWLQNHSDEHVQHHVLSHALTASRCFGCNHVETVVAILMGLSAAIGPAVLLQQGTPLPLSLHLLFTNDTHSAFPQTVEFFLNRTREILATHIGRHSRSRFDEPAQTERRSVTPPRHRLEEDDPMPESEQKRRDIQKAMSASQRQHQLGIFPLVETVTIDLVRRLTKEGGNVALACIGDGNSLRTFLNMKGQQRDEVDSFLKAGWRGTTYPSIDEHPVFPTASAIWGGTTQQVRQSIRKEIHYRLPGLLIIDSKREQVVEQSEIPSELRTYWKSQIESLITIRLLQAPRHQVIGGGLRILLEEKAAALLRETFSWSRLFCEENSECLHLMKHAPINVAKIAGLIHISTPEFEGQPIGVSEVRLAVEVYRHLLKGTLEAIKQTHEETARASWSDVDRLVAKMRRLNKPLTMREIVRMNDRQDYDWIGALLDKAIARGDMRVEDSKFRVVSSRNDGFSASSSL